MKKKHVVIYRHIPLGTANSYSTINEIIAFIGYRVHILIFYIKVGKNMLENQANNIVSSSRVV